MISGYWHGDFWGTRYWANQYFREGAADVPPVTLGQIIIPYRRRRR